MWSRKKDYGQFISTFSIRIFIHVRFGVLICITETIDKPSNRTAEINEHLSIKQVQDMAASFYSQIQRSMDHLVNMMPLYAALQKGGKKSWQTLYRALSR